MKKEISFEQALSRLEQIVAVLEEGDAPLDQTMKIFEEGVQLADLCSHKLNEAELKIRKLSQNDPAANTITD